MRRREGHGGNRWASSARGPSRGWATALILVALLASVVPTPVAAQRSAAVPTRVWLALGPAGGGVHNVDAGLGGLAQLTAQWGGRHHATLRMLGLADFSGFPDGSSDDGAGEFGATYGRASTTTFGYTAIAAGVSAVRVRGAVPPDGFTGTADDTRVTVGIPLTAEAGVQTTFIGLSLQAFANLNTVAPWAGVAGTVLLGWMP